MVVIDDEIADVEPAGTFVGPIMKTEHDRIGFIVRFVCSCDEVAMYRYGVMGVVVGFGGENPLTTAWNYGENYPRLAILENEDDRPKTPKE
ncbi:hypothetical protein Sjap_013226 [Stephania japonica]|uniref:Uncharacterized protein n=1 Tax=Stephania japonica TaxID=461633 RepID=A0AAP0NYY8_9MAGN